MHAVLDIGGAGAPPPTRRSCSAARTAPARACWRAPSTPEPARDQPVRGHQLPDAVGGAAGERAVRPRQGRVHRRRARSGRAASRSADGGTLFLDEIGEMPAGAAGQAAALPAGEGRSSASARRAPATADVRIVAATNRDLEADVKAGRFREDLFYRLNVVEMRLPPLRERREDILPLARALPEHASRAPPRPMAPEISAEPQRWRCEQLRLARQRARAAQRDRARSLILWPDVGRSSRRRCPSASPRAAQRRADAGRRLHRRRHRARAHPLVSSSASPRSTTPPRCWASTPRRSGASARSTKERNVVSRPSDPSRGNRSEDFLEMLRRAKRGRLKLYIGFAAGVGKTYRMLEEAHALKRRGVDVVLGFVETHRRAETQALLEGLDQCPAQGLRVPRRRHRGDGSGRAARTPPGDHRRRRDRAHQRPRQPQPAPLPGRAGAARRRDQRHRRLQHPAPREPQRRRPARDRRGDPRDRPRQLPQARRPGREPGSRGRGSARAAAGREDLRRRQGPLGAGALLQGPPPGHAARAGAARGGREPRPRRSRRIEDAGGQRRVSAYGRRGHRPRDGLHVVVPDRGPARSCGAARASPAGSTPTGSSSTSRRRARRRT